MPRGDSSGTGGNSRGGRESGGKLRAGGNRARNRAAKAESWLNQERETKKRGGRTHGGGLDPRRGGDGDPSGPAYLREGRETCAARRGPASSAPSRTPTAEPRACSLLRGPTETDGSEQSTAACAPASVRLIYSSAASSARLQWSGNPSPVFPSLPSALVLVCPFPSSLYCLRLLPCSALCLY